MPFINVKSIVKHYCCEFSLSLIKRPLPRCQHPRRYSTESQSQAWWDLVYSGVRWNKDKIVRMPWLPLLPPSWPLICRLALDKRYVYQEPNNGKRFDVKGNQLEKTGKPLHAIARGKYRSHEIV